VLLSRILHDAFRFPEQWNGTKPSTWTMQVTTRKLPRCTAYTWLCSSLYRSRSRREISRRCANMQSRCQGMLTCRVKAKAADECTESATYHQDSSTLECPTVYETQFKLSAVNFILRSGDVKITRSSFLCRTAPCKWRELRHTYSTSR
jgi:hypothetical protein